MRLRFALALVPLALLGALAACTEPNVIVDDIGVTRIFLVDPGLQLQSVTEGEGRIQIAQWDLSEATAVIAGNQVNLLVEDGESCFTTDTATSTPDTEGKCEGGVIIDSSTEAQPFTLALEFTMTARRAEPVDLPPAGDFDGDAVLNDVDNCPLLNNPDQQDGNLDGFGDACSITDVFGAVQLESDGDGVADNQDNCVTVPNPDQEDLDGLGVGDACTEQMATVRVAGDETIRVNLGPEDLFQAQVRLTFLTVDFDAATVLDCDWTSNSCELDPAALQLCVQTSSLVASLGCPD